MTEQVAFEPAWANPPGATIANMLQRRRLPLDEFAWEMEIPESEVTALFEGKIHLNDTMAHRLEKVLGVSADFWIVREAQYRSDTQKLAQRIPEAEANSWIRALPTKDMVSYGWIGRCDGQQSLVAECLRFFDVSSIAHFNQRMEGLVGRTKFRTSANLRSKQHSLGAWLRYGELTAQSTNCEDWNPAKLRKLLPEMRKLTRLRDPMVFMPKLFALCASAGVVLVTAKSPDGCRASGATMFVSEKKALILLSFRHLSDDHFWFSFFHECGHLLLHPHNMVIVEGESPEDDEMEKEANQFSEDVLIPAPWKQLLQELKPNREAIVRFAVRAGVSPGIVVGQLQHRGRIGHNFLNYLKRRYVWVS